MAYRPVSHPCSSFAQLRWSTGPTVFAHPPRFTRLEPVACQPHFSEARVTCRRRCRVSAWETCANRLATDPAKTYPPQRGHPDSRECIHTSQFRMEIPSAAHRTRQSVLQSHPVLLRIPASGTGTFPVGHCSFTGTRCSLLGVVLDTTDHNCRFFTATAWVVQLLLPIYSSAGSRLA